jgi:tetratricopeptide (TPR) repeat protein
LFLTITLILLEIYREKRSRIIPVILPFLSLLWANCHASFFLLPGIAGAYLLGDIAVEKLRGRLKWYKPDGPYLNRDSRIWLLVSIIFSLVAPVFTPNGLDTYIYPFKISFGKFTNYVTEYQHFWSVWTWNLSDLDLAFTFILMVSLWGIFIIHFKKLHPTDFILGTAFTFMALTAIRHEAIFALVAMFLITKFISRRFGEYRGIFKRTLIRDILVIILLICFVYYFKTQISGFGFRLDESGYPKAAADLINDSNLAGNMFNHYNYGGYLIWKPPDYPVFIDGRLEMYEGQIGKDYMDILEGIEGYESLLDKYKINFFLINSNEMIVEKLVYDDNWKIVFSDGRYLVFVKNVPQNADFLKEHWSKDTEDTFRENYKNALAESRAQIYTNQGIDAFKSGNIEYAIQNFKAVVILAPESVEARLNLAEAYFRAGLYTDAGGEYDYIILKLDPGNQKAKTALKIISEYEKK